jgi:hypothetical protein
MDAKAFRKDDPRDEQTSSIDENRSRIVHRVGPPASGLFPGWGPKL